MVCEHEYMNIPLSPNYRSSYATGSVELKSTHINIHLEMQVHV